MSRENGGWTLVCELKSVEFWSEFILLSSRVVGMVLGSWVTVLLRLVRVVVVVRVGVRDFLFVSGRGPRFGSVSGTRSLA